MTHHAMEPCPHGACRCCQRCQECIIIRQGDLISRLERYLQAIKTRCETRGMTEVAGNCERALAEIKAQQPAGGEHVG